HAAVAPTALAQLLLPEAAAGAAAAGLLELGALLYLLAAAAAGFGITYWSGVGFTLEERVVFGVVLGGAAVSVATFVPALVARDVTLVTALLGLAATLALGAAGAVLARSRVTADWMEAKRGWRSRWPLLAVLLVGGAWTVLGLAFPGVLYLAAVRFLGERAGAAIAVFLFVLSGGLGFVYLSGDLQRFGLEALAHLPREYTLNRDVNLQWLNPVLGYLVPQRSTLFGFSLALILLVVLWIAVRERLAWRPFLFAGLVAATLPVFHVHSWGPVVALPAFWALFNRRPQWITFFAPALVVGIPILAWMWPPDNTS